MSQKVLQISAEDAKYIDPNQIASIQMVDGTTIMVNNGEQAQPQEEFVEEAQNNEEQYKTEDTKGQQQDGQKLRGRGLVGALAGAAAGAALLGTAAAVGSAMRRPYGYGYGMGMRPMMPPPPMMRPPMMGPHFGMMRGPRFY